VSIPQLRFVATEAELCAILELPRHLRNLRNLRNLRLLAERSHPLIRLLLSDLA